MGARAAARRLLLLMLLLQWAGTIALLTTSFFLGDVSASLHAGDCLICRGRCRQDKIKNGHHGAKADIGTAAWSPPPPPWPRSSRSRSATCCRGTGRWRPGC
ncbi:unnamed protein product [Miscanthus lutarioriparius]|uniref:Uncharacterized protein n=1 Tax=Miscanthus lutarioriparius TaxID=422564 RepID=A0A811S578_9POAL|nr:unnamed protein product [Miscanthus lutarioriparius]